MIKMILLSLLVLIVFVLWYFKLPQSPRATQFQGIIFAHRGYTKNAPENSLASIEAAAGYPNLAMELDVRITKDGVLVLMHDSTVNRTTNGEGRVADYTLQELKALRLSDGSTVPTLDEVLATIKRVGVKAEFDIDGRENMSIMIPELVRLISQYELYDSVLVTSFWPQVGYALRKQDQKIITALAIPARDQGIIHYVFRYIVAPFFVWFAGIGGIEPHDEYSDEKFIRSWMPWVQFINVWTVNFVEQKQLYERLGVTYTTDCPFGVCMDDPSETVKE